MWQCGWTLRTVYIIARFAKFATRLVLSWSVALRLQLKDGPSTLGWPWLRSPQRGQRDTRQPAREPSHNITSSSSILLSSVSHSLSHRSHTTSKHSHASGHNSHKNNHHWLTASYSKQMDHSVDPRWGLELWDCLDQVLGEVAINNSFLLNTCSKYIRYIIDKKILKIELQIFYVKKFYILGREQR